MVCMCDLTLEVSERHCIHNIEWAKLGVKLEAGYN